MQCDKNMQLVKSIEKFPCLYNSNLIDYLRKDVTDEAWNVVANETQLTVSECKEKWKNLRYGLLRSLRINPDGTAKKKYYLHDEMEFLLPFIKTSKHETILHAIDETVLDMNVENVVNEQDMEYTPVQPSHHQLFEISEQSKKRLRPNDTLIKKSHQRSIQNHDYEDSRKMFLLSLLPEIYTLTEPQMRVFRRKVLTLIDEIGDGRPIQCETCLLECHNDSANHELQEAETHSHNNLIKKEPL